MSSRALIIALVSLSALLAAIALRATAAGNEAYAFVNANLIPMTSEEVLTGQTLVVREGRIAAIGPEVGLEGDESVIDAEGRFLMPGLAEMHAHVPPPEEPDYLNDVLFLWLANGVTTARGVLGHESHLGTRAAVDEHRLPGPRLYVSGPSLNGESVSSPEQGRRMVREQHEAGYDLVKLHPGLRREEFDAIADEANRLGIDFVGHVSLDVGLEHALERGQHTIEHLDGYVHALVEDPEAHEETAQAFFGVNLMPHVDEGRIEAVIEATREAGAAVVPTQTLFENVATPLEELNERAELAYLPSDLLERYREAIEDIGGNPHLTPMLELRKRLIRELHAAGVPVLLGSDSPQIFNVPGFSIHRELEAMTAAGLSPYEALKTGTVAVGRHFGNDTGTLEVGQEADIVMLADNPLEDISHTAKVEGVMVRGAWFDPERRRQVLANIAQRYEAQAE